MSISTILHQAQPTLQSGEHLESGVQYLPATPHTVRWGRLPGRDDEAAASILPGERIIIDTVSHEGLMEDQGGDPLVFFTRHGVSPDDILTDTVDIARQVTRDITADGPHIVTGPVRVEGAMPGDLLAVTIERLDMRAPYGVVSTRHGRGVLAGVDSVEGTYSQFCPVSLTADGWVGSIPLRDESDTESARFALSPFLGIIGVVADQPGRLHSVPPGLHGGNLDVNLLVEGSTLYLPVQVEGGMLYAGDPHFAQGDGEVALTALEAPLRATLSVDLIPAAMVNAELGAVTGPFATADGILIPTGLSEDLDEALRLCTTNALELLTALFDMDRRLAYLYLSAAANFRISQAVDVVKGVHGELRLGDFVTSRPTPLVQRILGGAL
ncbi:MAG: acetamidase/formamidase family protein [Mycetocola sp.]